MPAGRCRSASPPDASAKGAGAGVTGKPVSSTDLGKEGGVKWSAYAIAAWQLTTLDF
jgi:hypothetical protein